jgi:phosphatidylinositol 3-kinase
VGDRHLDNILVKSTGELFHVDFSFVFGKDPKAFKSKMRITNEMIQALGGTTSPLFEHFLNIICHAFSILRKSSGAIMNLLRLMMSSNIPDFTLRQKSIDVMTNTLELFQLHLSEEEASIYIKNVVHESIAAVMPTVLERMHRIANAFR